MNTTTSNTNPTISAPDDTAAKTAAKTLAKSKIDVEKIDKVIGLINGDARPLDDLVVLLKKDFGAKITEKPKDGWFKISVAGVDARARTSLREAVINWQNAARRAKLHA